MKKFIVTNYEYMILTAESEQDRIIALDASPAGASLKTGDIVLCAVKNISDNIRAAFCDLGNGKTGFLPLSECPVPPKGRMLIPVQVKREAAGSKEEMLTARFSLAGRYLVFLYAPKGERFCVSKKVQDRKLAARIREMLAQVCENPSYGFIIRTNAFAADPDMILREAKVLIGKADRILADAAFRTPGNLLSPAPDFLRERLLGLQEEEEAEVISDDAACLDALQKDPVLAGIRFSTRSYDDAWPLAKLFRLSHYLDLARSRKVWLKSGGYLIIDRTEAMTVIDVNTGSAISGKDKEETFLRTNLEAAAEIGYQIRLRNLSGIILADLINMKDKDHWKDVEAAFQEAFRHDPAKAVLVDITKLGLAEITRQKKRNPLDAQLTILDNHHSGV